MTLFKVVNGDWELIIFGWSHAPCAIVSARAPTDPTNLSNL